jgi:hypothetical protein
MGSCLSSEAPATGDGPAAWRKRHHKSQEGAAGGGGKKLPGGAGEMTEDELAWVLERLCGKGASAVASLHTQQDRKGTNQDAMVVWEGGGTAEGADAGRGGDGLGQRSCGGDRRREDGADAACR